MIAQRAKIRLLGPGDVEAFRSIRLEALRNEPAAFASSFEDWARLSDEEWRRRLTDNPVFVAFDGTIPIGIMGLLRQRPSRMIHRATIVMVYVNPAYRGTGLSGHLLDVVFGHARESGVRQLELAASAENPTAIQFYRRRGFSDVGRIPGGYLHEGREIDEILMACRLS